MTERMKQAVRAYMDWLRMGPGDPGALDECPVEDRLAPLGLSMRQHEKALRHALTKLMKKGYVIRMLDGRPQAVPLDDVPEAHREEILRRRRDPSEDEIVGRHGGVGIGFLSVSDEETEKYYGSAPDKSNTEGQAERAAIFVEIDSTNLDVEATMRQLVANGISEWQARQMVIELQQSIRGTGETESRSFVKIDCKNLDVEATARQLVANGIPEWQARQMAIELQQRMRGTGETETRS